MKRKYKILAIIFLILFSIIFITFIYSFFFKKKEKVVVKFYVVKKLIDEKILYPELLGDEMYYFSVEKNEYRKVTIKNNQSELKVLINNLNNIDDVKLLPGGKALLYRDLKSGIYSIYDFESRNKKDLDKFINSATWFPLDENVILGSYSNPPQNNINLYHWKSGERKEILNLLADVGLVNDITLDGKKISYFRSETWSVKEAAPPLEDVPPDETGSFIFVIYDLDSNQEVLKSADIENGKFDINGQKILVSKLSSGVFPNLSVIDLKTLEEKPLFLNTYFNKVSFTNDPNVIVYARVEDFQGARTRDTLWKQNLISGKKVQLTQFDPNQPIDAQDLMISSDNQKIYFINQYDGKLYVAERE